MVSIVNWGTLVPHLQVIAIFAGADLRDFPGKSSDLGGTSQVVGVTPIAGWFISWKIMDNPIKMNDLHDYMILHVYIYNIYIYIYIWRQLFDHWII